MKPASDNLIPKSPGYDLPVSKLRLKFPGDQDEVNGGVVTLIKDETEQETSEDDRLIRCVQCLHGITRVGDGISRQGMHRHTFANPHGIVFEIGCFKEAAGCGYAGAPTAEFTWFPGYAWRIAVCKKCTLHLGWLFLSTEKDRFNGLIVDRLVYPEKT